MNTKYLHERNSKVRFLAVGGLCFLTAFILHEKVNRFLKGEYIC